jgi:hypothetical protein
VKGYGIALCGLAHERLSSIHEYEIQEDKVDPVMDGLRPSFKTGKTSYRTLDNEINEIDERKESMSMLLPSRT